jgi:hypothetical protein
MSKANGPRSELIAKPAPRVMSQAPSSRSARLWVRAGRTCSSTYGVVIVASRHGRPIPVHRWWVGVRDCRTSRLTRAKGTTRVAAALASHEMEGGIRDTYTDLLAPGHDEAIVFEPVAEDDEPVGFGRDP